MSTCAHHVRYSTYIRVWRAGVGAMQFAFRAAAAAAPQNPSMMDDRGRMEGRRIIISYVYIKTV